MKIYVVYAHPSKKSFTAKVLAEFLRGLRDAGHEYEVGDLYEMGFQTDMDEEQYMREMGGDPDAPLPPDVAEEHRRILAADALAFVFPLWWSDCPAKLKGWFDRVLSFGFAYRMGEDGHMAAGMKSIRKALVLCPAGNPLADLDEKYIPQSMRFIILGDRLLNVGVQSPKLLILDGTAGGAPQSHLESLLQKAYRAGADF